MRLVPLRDHQVSRIRTFLFPESDMRGAGYTLRQAKIAIGSGGMIGKGVGHLVRAGQAGGRRIERAEDVRHSPLGKASYALRSQTIERVFADAKEKHAMRYTPYRGLPAVTAWVKLKCAAMNLKKLAIHKWMRLLFSAFLSYKKPDCKLAIWLL